MTSRERIMAATAHEQPDLLPIDFGAMGSSGISVLAYNRLKKYLGLEDEATKLYDIGQQLALPSMQVIDRLGGDVVQVTRGTWVDGRMVDEWKPWKLKDGSDCLVPSGFNPVRTEDGTLELRHNGVTMSIMPPDGWFFSQVHVPYADLVTEADIDGIELGLMSDEEVDFIGRQAKRLYETTDKALFFSFGGNMLETSLNDWGHEKFFMMMAAEPELVHYWFEKLAETHMANLKKVMPAIADYVQIVGFGDDLGTQNAPQISPKMYRDLVYPYHRMQYRYVREHYPQCRVFLHSCGAIYDLIPDLIEAGVQVLNPVQISANGMDPQKLKDNFGRDITFWGGGANMQHVVEGGMIEDIRANVKHLINIFAPGGGYVFNQVHNIQANVSPEKVMAIYDTALQWREGHRR